MENNNIVTQDLSRFGYREIEEAADILKAYANRNMTERAYKFFDEEGLTLNFNTYSGYVFLSNSNYDVLMLKDKKFDLWLTTPYDGYEDFSQNYSTTKPKVMSNAC